MTDSHLLPAAVAAALEEPGEGQRITVEAAGIPWSAIQWGDAATRPLLLIHGVTSSAATWWRVGPALAASGHRVTAVDLPGHGQTGHWQGHVRFRDNAADVAAFVSAAGLAVADLQVIGHSWGAMTAAALPSVGLGLATLVLLDPPVIPLERISLEASDSAQQVYDDVADTIAALRAVNPGWVGGDIRAKAEALTQLDEGAVRAVVFENGDWDGGLRDLRDPAAAGIDIWIVRSDPEVGGYVADEALPAFQAVVGTDHICTIVGAPHSPHRTHPIETTAALLAALADQPRASRRISTARS